MKKGKIIVIEGSDGSGKDTQSKKLLDRLLIEGKKCIKISFPDYESDSSALVKMYLGGAFGDNPKDINPFASSTFYAIDRFASFKTKWESLLNEGYYIILDRYTTSNMIHQASKLPSQEKDSFLDWLWDFEFNLLGLPIPDEIFFLDVPPEVSLSLIKNRLNKITNEQKKDIHEKNKEFLKESYKNAMYICNKYNWIKINCCKDSTILSIDCIHNKIYKNLLSQKII